MHLLAADSHPLVLDALVACLKRLQPDAVVEAAREFEEAVNRAAKVEKLDLIILGLRMPGMSGLKCLEEMKARFPEVPVAMLSADCDAELVREALARGAAGFLPKELAGQALLKAVELILRGETYVPPAVLRELSSGTLNGSVDRETASEGPLAKLTPRKWRL